MRDRKEYNRAYRQANKEKIAAKQKEYRETNKEKIVADSKEYREANKEKIVTREKEYREVNKEKRSTRNKAWRHENKEHCSEYNKTKWRETIKPLLESDPQKFIHSKLKKIKRRSNLNIDYLMQIFNNQNGRCAITNIKMTTIFGDQLSISIDRIDSSIEYLIGNVQLVCKAINLAKQHHTQEETLELVRLIRENQF